MAGPSATRVPFRAGGLVLAADLAGTFVFAVGGALAAIGGGLDLLGVLVLAFATALGGGIARDLLIGAVPPSAIADWRYPSAAFVAGSVTFVFHSWIRHIPADLLIALDAMGLALFAIAGTGKASAYGIRPFMAALMGTVTAVGGGTMRDVLLAQVPMVLRTDIYATAALAGSLAMVAARRAGVSAPIAALAGGILCFVVRLVAVWQGWYLPTALVP